MKMLRDMKEGVIENKEITAVEKQKLVASFKNNEMFKGMDDENIFWSIMLFFMALLEHNEIVKLWDDYKEQIKHSSRFFPKSELLNKVKEISEHATAKLEKGTILYRAREYKKTDYICNKAVLAVFDEIRNLYPDLDFRIEDLLSESSMEILLLILRTDDVKLNQIVDAAREAKEKKNHFGALIRRIVMLHKNNIQDQEGRIPKVLVIYIRQWMKKLQLWKCDHK